MCSIRSRTTYCSFSGSMRSQETVDQPEWLGANKGRASRGLGLNALGDYVSGTVAACQALSRFR